MRSLEVTNVVRIFLELDLRAVGRNAARRGPRARADVSKVSAGDCAILTLIGNPESRCLPINKVGRKKAGKLELGVKVCDEALRRERWVLALPGRATGKIPGGQSCHYHRDRSWRRSPRAES